MNHFFDEFVNASTGMKEFVVQSQKAIEKQFIRERKADYITQHRKRNMVLGSSLEVHAAQVYTKEMFRSFQRQFVDSIKYNVSKVSELCGPETKVYVVYKTDAAENGGRYKEIVNNCQLGSVTCNCQLFSHSGELCRHILRYFLAKSISQIPSDMILSRWTRNANKTDVEELLFSPTTADFEQDQAMRFNHLMNDCQELACKVACSVRGYKTVLKLNARGKALVDQYDPDENLTELADDDIDRTVRDTPQAMGYDNDDEDAEEEAEEDEFLPPVISQTKGRKNNQD